MTNPQETRRADSFSAAVEEYLGTGRVDNWISGRSGNERAEVLAWAAETLCRMGAGMDPESARLVEEVGMVIGATLPFHGGNVFRDMLDHYHAGLLLEQGVKIHRDGDRKAFEEWYRQNMVRINLRFLRVMQEAVNANEHARNAKGVEALRSFGKDLAALSKVTAEFLVGLR